VRLSYGNKGFTYLLTYQNSAAFAVPVEDESHAVQIVKWKMAVHELLESQLQTPDWFNLASLSLDPLYELQACGHY